MKTKHELVGNFFHSFRYTQKKNRKICEENLEKHVEWQGLVLDVIHTNGGETYLLVQLFEWMMGEPNKRKLINITQALDFDFYQNEDQMKETYDRIWSHRK